MHLRLPAVVSYRQSIFYAWSPWLKLSWFIHCIGILDSSLLRFLEISASARKSLGMFPQRQLPDGIGTSFLFCSSVGLSKSYLSCSYPTIWDHIQKHITHKSCVWCLSTIVCKGHHMFIHIHTYILYNISINVCTRNCRYCLSCVCIRCSKPLLPHLALQL